MSIKVPTSTFLNRGLQLILVKLCYLLNYFKGSIRYNELELNLARSKMDKHVIENNIKLAKKQ